MSDGNNGRGTSRGAFILAILVEMSGYTDGLGMEMTETYESGANNLDGRDF